MLNIDPVLAGLASVGVASFVMLNEVGKRHRRDKHLVGHLKRITLFPVKSMRGVDVKEAGCTYTGLTAKGFNDRCLMVVDHKREFVSARKLPKMSTISASIENSKICLDAPDSDPISVSLPNGHSQEQEKITVTVWDEELEAIDCGDEVAKWLQNVLQRNNLHLVYHEEHLMKRHCDQVDTPWHKLAKPHDQVLSYFKRVIFQDGFPYMLLSEETLQDLNNRLKKHVSMNNFRPNLVVEGCEPYDEDAWDKIFIGDVELFNIKPCHRCIMTTVDPETGKRDPKMEPLKTLKSYRLLPKDAPQFWVDDPVFGVNLVAIKPGVIHVGDPVFATIKY